MRNQQGRLAAGQDLLCEEFRQLRTGKRHLYYLMMLEYQSHPKYRLQVMHRHYHLEPEPNGRACLPRLRYEILIAGQNKGRSSPLMTHSSRLCPLRSRIVPSAQSSLYCRSA